MKRRHVPPLTPETFEAMGLAVENLGKRLSDEISRRDADNKAQAKFNEAVLRLIGTKASIYTEEA